MKSKFSASLCSIVYIYISQNEWRQTVSHVICTGLHHKLKEDILITKLLNTCEIWSKIQERNSLHFVWKLCNCIRDPYSFPNYYH